MVTDCSRWLRGFQTSRMELLEHGDGIGGIIVFVVAFVVAFVIVVDRDTRPEA